MAMPMGPADLRQRRQGARVETLTAAKAREKARKLLAEVALGGDSQADKRERREKDSLSLWSVVADFLAHKTGVKEGTMRMLRA
jgi:hypothetical protein